MDTQPDSQWPPHQKRAEDREWFATVRQYDGVILIVIAVVLILGGIMTWMDRRDYIRQFGRVNENITALTAQASAMQAVLSRVEGTVGTLSRQNERWISVEREVSQQGEAIDALQSESREVKARVQRIEDQRTTEREMQGRP